MRIVAGTYEGFCYGWESNAAEPAVDAAAGLPTTATTTKKRTLQASQPSATSPPQPLSLVFGYNVHVGCMKSVAMATSGARAGQLLVTGGVDERVRIYNLKDRSELGELQQHNGESSSSGSSVRGGWLQRQGGGGHAVTSAFANSPFSWLGSRNVQNVRRRRWRS